MTATDKLAGIKPGDRVRVTFEGVVGDNPRPDIPDVYPLAVKTDGREVENIFHGGTVKAPTFHIERLEKPLEVGDRVRWTQGVVDCEIVAFRDDKAVLWGAGRAYCDFIENLERIA